MSNVIPIKPHCETLGPSRALNELYALCARLGQLKSDTVLVQQKLDRDRQKKETGLTSRQSLNRAMALISSAQDEIMEAIADLIVEITVSVIVPPKLQED